MTSKLPISDADKQHIESVLKELTQCIDKLEDAGLREEIDFQANIVNDLTLTQIMESLIHAERELKKLVGNGDIEVTNKEKVMIEN